MHCTITELYKRNITTVWSLVLYPGQSPCRFALCRRNPEIVNFLVNSWLWACGLQNSERTKGSVKENKRSKLILGRLNLPYIHTGNGKRLKSTDLCEIQLYTRMSVLNVSLSSFFCVLFVFYPTPYAFISAGNWDHFKVFLTQRQIM